MGGSRERGGGVQGGGGVLGGWGDSRRPCCLGGDPCHLLR